jgi:ABC-type sugar transport system ATPase subunit
MATVDVEQISKVYPNDFHAVKDLNLAVKDPKLDVAQES